MPWYYAVDKQQKGPVSDEEFAQLVRQGVVTPGTLVWQEGMESWQAYGSITPAGGGPPPVTGVATTLCSECGKSFPRNEVIQFEGRSVCAVCKPIFLQRMREGATTDDKERVRRQYLTHEVSVKSIGTLYLLGSFFCLVGGLVIFGEVVSGRSRSSEDLLSAVVGIVLSVVYFFTGLGVRKLKPWTRTIVGILSVLGLCAIPCGTVISAYFLWLVFSANGKMVYSDEYKEVMEATPHIKYKTSIIVWIFLGILLLLIGMGIMGVLMSGFKR